MNTITNHYIDGAFVESHGREVMDIIKPTNGQLIGRVTLGDEEDTRRAIAAAKSAFAAFSRTKKEERAKILRRLHEAAPARVDDLTAAMIEEYGGVAQFSSLIVKIGHQRVCRGRTGARQDTVDAQLGQGDRDDGTGRRRRFDNRLER